MGDEHTQSGQHTPDPRLASLTRITLRPLGSALPLGFLGLAGASLMVSALQLRWVGSGSTHQVAVAVLVFAVPMETIASVFGFLSRDSVGGTGNSLLAGSWLVTTAVLLTSPPGSTTPLLGIASLFAAFALTVPGVSASLGKVLAAIIMFGAGVRFALTGIYELSGRRSWENVSGWWGVGLCVVALYGAMAFELEDTRRRTVLPVLRHGVGRAAVEGGLPPDLDRLESEAGVREQL